MLLSHDDLYSDELPDDEDELDASAGDVHADRTPGDRDVSGDGHAAPGGADVRAEHAASPDDDAPDPQDLRELDLLAHVHQAHQERTRTTQRNLSRALGLSLGMTNAILKRLVNKGFLMVRRINSANVHYLVTPAGVDQLSHRSYLYLRRTVGHVVRYKERLRHAMHRFRAAGVKEIVLVGESDLEFLLEWCAQKEGLSFCVVSEADRARSDDRTNVDGGAPEHGPALERGPAGDTTLWILSERTPARQRADHKDRKPADAPARPVDATAPDDANAAESRTTVRLADLIAPPVGGE